MRQETGEKSFLKKTDLRLSGYRHLKAKVQDDKEEPGEEPGDILFNVGEDFSQP